MAEQQLPQGCAVRSVFERPSQALPPPSRTDYTNKTPPTANGGGVFKPQGQLTSFRQPRPSAIDLLHRILLKRRIRLQTHHLSATMQRRLARSASAREEYPGCAHPGFPSPASTGRWSRPVGILQLHRRITAIFQIIRRRLQALSSSSSIGPSNAVSWDARRPSISRTTASPQVLATA